MRSAAVVLLATIITAPVAGQSTQTPPTTPTTPAPAPTSGYGAWFGSIPNMENPLTGILLTGVTAGSPAEKAGLDAGDLITSIGGKAMNDLRDMVDVLRSKQPGDTVEVVFRRLNQEQKVKVVLGTRPAN